MINLQNNIAYIDGANLHTRNSSLLEVGQDAALYVRSMNVRELTDVLEQLVVDPTLRSTIRTRGLARAQAFSWHEAAQAFSRVISRKISPLRPDGASVEMTCF